MSHVDCQNLCMSHTKVIFNFCEKAHLLSQRSERRYQNFLSRLGPRGLCDDDGRGSLVIDGLNVSIGGSGGPRGKGCSKSQQSANVSMNFFKLKTYAV